LKNHKRQAETQKDRMLFPKDIRVKDKQMNEQNNNNIIRNLNLNNQVIKADINLIFSGDPYGLFVFKKTEKIVTAIYMLTTLLSDKEPMRYKLRDVATRMLETGLAMSERVWGEDIFHKNLINACCETTLLFDIALKTKMISPMNHQIINSEVEKFSNFLVTSSSTYSSAKVAFEPTMFDGNYNFAPEQGYKTLMDQINRGENNLPENYKGQKDNMKNDVLKQMSERKSEKIVKDKGNRQEIIIAMLKGGLKLTIKDFAKNIKNCSEKTIQRELIALLSKGVLKKEGERRWSKYFLA
jgi:hypothetical protein